VLQCVAVCCSVLQCAAVCCSVLQCAAVGCTCVTAGSATRMPSYSNCDVETSSRIFGLSTQSHNQSHFSNPVFNCVAYEASFCIVILYTIQLFSVQEHNGFLYINTNVLRAAVVFFDVQYYLDSIHSILRPFRLSHTFFGRGVGSNHVVKWQDQDTATHCNALKCFSHTHIIKINKKTIEILFTHLGKPFKNLYMSLHLETSTHRISTTHAYTHACIQSVSVNEACHVLFEWCAAVYCNLLQCVAVCSLLRNTLKNTATHYNFIQCGFLAPKTSSLSLPPPRPASVSLSRSLSRPRLRSRSCSRSCSRYCSRSCSRSPSIPVSVSVLVCLSVCLSLSVSLSLIFHLSVSLAAPLSDALSERHGQQVLV